MRQCMQTTTHDTKHQELLEPIKHPAKCMQEEDEGEDEEMEEEDEEEEEEEEKNRNKQDESD